jgi:hypothetical protein
MKPAFSADHGSSRESSSSWRLVRLPALPAVDLHRRWRQRESRRSSPQGLVNGIAADGLAQRSSAVSAGDV